MHTIMARILSYRLVSSGKSKLQFIGGVDISFAADGSDIACASLVVLSFPSLSLLWSACERCEMDLPYIPGKVRPVRYCLAPFTASSKYFFAGFLAFREVKPLSGLIERLRHDHPGMWSWTLNTLIAGGVDAAQRPTLQLMHLLWLSVCRHTIPFFCFDQI